MKHILLLTCLICFLPLVILALWFISSDPALLDKEDDYPVLINNNVLKGDVS